MPLLKLWNRLRGRRDLPKPSDDREPCGPQARTGSSVATNPKSAGRGILGMGSRRPHAALCKLLRRVQAKTVLEIGIGDGSRGIAALGTLCERNPQVLYAAIDQFEMAGGPLTLKGFHQALRTAEVRSAKIFPDTIEHGLLRVATTLGPVDLVLIATPPERWQTPVVLALIARVTHRDTVVFYEDGDGWRQFEPPTRIETRRAA